MFLKITKTKNGYQFRNGLRRMPMDEVARRCPVEMVREIDEGAADYLAEFIGAAKTEVFAPTEWMTAWGYAVGVENVRYAQMSLADDGRGILSVGVEYDDPTNTRTGLAHHHCALFPSDVAEVLMQGMGRVTHAEFTATRDLVVSYKPTRKEA